MADTAHRLTDEKLEEMEKRLSAIHSKANKEIGKRWKEYLSESQSEIDGLQKEYEIAKKRRQAVALSPGAHGAGGLGAEEHPGALDGDLREPCQHNG